MLKNKVKQIQALPRIETDEFCLKYVFHSNYDHGTTEYYFPSQKGAQTGI